LLEDIGGTDPRGQGMEKKTKIGVHPCAVARRKRSTVGKRRCREKLKKEY